MPNLNGTGPQGQGPMTGKAMGYCAENSSGNFSGASANSNFGLGRGLRRGGGRGAGLAGRGQGGLGRGFRWKQVEITQEEEQNFLRNELKALESETENIKKRLGDLKA